MLLRRAADVRPAEAVRGWLYGVAVRCAKEARAVNARRRRRETPVPTLPERAALQTEPPDPDALAALDEAVAQLPEHLRAAVVLCELEGLSRREAAGRLGLAEGTLSSRLAKARKLLAERLRNRRLVLPAAGLAVLAHVAVSPKLLAQTSALVSAGAAVPPAVAALTSGVFRTMFLHKLTLAGAVVALAALTYTALMGNPPEPPATSARADQPKAAATAPPKGPNRLAFWRDGNLVTCDPDGANEKKLDLGGAYAMPTTVRLSPDGKAVAYVVLPGAGVKPRPVGAPAPKAPQRPKLYVRQLNGPAGPGTDLGAEFAAGCDASCCWSSDGAEIACTQVDATNDRIEVSSFVVNVKTKERTALKLPSDHAVSDWTADGRLLTTGSIGKGQGAELFVMNRDGTQHKALAPGDVASSARPSPDGARALVVTFRPVLAAGAMRQEQGLAVLDMKTGKLAAVRDVPPDAIVHSCCWSPDGKRIAYSWRPRVDVGPAAADTKTASHLVVCDADGRNAKTVTSRKGMGPHQLTIGGLDWR